MALKGQGGLWQGTVDKLRVCHELLEFRLKPSVACQNCGRQFRNIKREFTGKKARCPCGAILYLETATKSKQIPPADDLLNVDLLGTDMLVDSPAPQAPSASVSSNELKKAKTKSQANERPRKRTDSNQKKSTSKIRESSKSQSPSRRGAQPESSAKPKRPRKKSRKSITVDPKPKPGRISAPEVSVTLTPSRSGSPTRQRPVFEQTYGDLDDILSSVGDASPIRVPNTREDSLDTTSRQSESKAVSSGGRPAVQLDSSTAGFLAALVSATLAFWFGLFVVVSRFQSFDSFLLGGFYRHLSSVYSVSFGDGAVPTVFQVAFSLLGWLIWIVAVALTVFAIVQFVNAFTQLLTGRQPVSWADGLTGTLGVVAVFLMVGIVFCEVSFANHELRALDAYEQPFVEEGERLANVARLREIIEDRNRSFVISMLIGAAIPMFVFSLSMVRLFTKTGSSTTGRRS